MCNLQGLFSQNSLDPWNKIVLLFDDGTNIDRQTVQQLVMDEEQHTITTFPILPYADTIKKTVLSNRVTVICGETGSGKTTQVPQYLTPHFTRIVVSQPRRISAITLAQRVAYEMGVEVGQEVGYNVRFEEAQCANTRIVFVTDGMAVRQLMMGMSYDLFILDEAHERSINTDVLMAILRERILDKKGKFRLVIMSATIDAAKFMSFFNTDALINIQGRTHPTQVFNLVQPTQNYLQTAYNTILQVHSTEQPGDILSFLTGQDEIVSLKSRLQKVITEHKLDLEVLMLYSALPHQYQYKVFSGQRRGRRVILSTNIAQTSVTIPGVRYVVDCGFMKVRHYDNSRMLDMLIIVPVSQANALQRAGRAGREAPGKCYRLYLKNSYEELEAQTSPQILRSELSGPILQLKAVGVQSIRGLKFMDQPEHRVMDECLRSLTELGCITGKEEITEYGLQVSRIPLPPRLAHLLLLSLQFKCQALMLSVVSLLSIDNLFLPSAVTQKGTKKTTLYEVLMRYMPTLATTSTHRMTNRLTTSDHLAKSNILLQYHQARHKETFCKQNHINRNSITRALMIRQQLSDYMGQIYTQRQKKSFFKLGSQQSQPTMAIQTSKATPENVREWVKCMQKGSSQTIARLNRDKKYSILGSGQIAQIHPQSACFYLPQKPQMIVFSQVVKTNRVYLKEVTVLPDS